MNTIFKLAQKLRDPEYRRAFVASQVNIGIPFQLRALLKSRGWTQDELARQAGMKQPRISAMLKPGKVSPNIETLRRLAEAFDVGLMVKFVPFSELARWSDSFNPESFNVPEFPRDAALWAERNEPEQTEVTRKLSSFGSVATGFGGVRRMPVGFEGVMPMGSERAMPAWHWGKGLKKVIVLKDVRLPNLDTWASPPAASGTMASPKQDLTEVASGTTSPVSQPSSTGATKTPLLRTLALVVPINRRAKRQQPSVFQRSRKRFAQR